MGAIRRSVLASGLAAGLVGAVKADVTAFDAIPPIPPAFPPGKLGDFDFLHGDWRIAHRMLNAKTGAWDAFEGEATCRTLLGGLGSVEELRIPVRDFHGIGLRLLDMETKVWSDFWVNAKSGVLTSPGQLGGFVDGAGLFASEFEEGGETVTSVGVWDRIAPNACRWRQAVSRDGRKTWAQNWIMDWRRV